MRSGSPWCQSHSKILQENCRPAFHPKAYRCWDPQQNARKRSDNVGKGVCTATEWDDHRNARLVQRADTSVTPCQSYKGKNVVLNRQKKSMCQNSTPFHDKNTQHTRNSRELPQPGTGSAPLTLLSGDRLRTSPKMSSKTRVPLAPLSLSVVLGVLLGAGRQDRERRGFQIEAEEVELFADEMLLCVGNVHTHTCHNKQTNSARLQRTRSVYK